MEAIFISKKYSIFVTLALALLTGTIIWREIEKMDNASQTIVIHSAPEMVTTAVQSEEKIVITLKKEVTTKLHSSKSTNSTKMTNNTTEILEAHTTPVTIYVNINNASADELIQINGIGEHLAEQIILYREENGGFRNIEELVNISGIGEKVFEKIRDYVYVENPVYDEYEPEPPVEEEIEKVIIEKITEAPPTLEDLAPINLNEANIELLMYLPYIDEEIAQRIIALREEIDAFSNPYELLLVDGITEEILSEIIKYIYV